MLEIDGLSVGYGWTGRPVVTIVRDVSLTVGTGEVVGIAGESGCGKTTLALAATGLLDPPGQILSGAVRYQGTDLTSLSPQELRELRLTEISMVFQASMNVLNPVMRIRDQFLDAMAAHGVESSAEARKRAEETFDLVKIPRRFFDAYPHQLSGGMRQRVMIAMAIVNRPQLLIADEPTTALDVTIQQQILDLLNDLRHKFGLAMLFISHDLAVVSHVADRVAVMYAGNLVELGAKADIFRAPAHPYTQGLLRAIPTLATDRALPLATIEGTVPPIAQLPPGCPFEPRCSHRIPTCADELPALIEVSPNHWARCPVVNPPRI